MKKRPGKHVNELLRSIERVQQEGKALLKEMPPTAKRKKLAETLGIDLPTTYHRSPASWLAQAKRLRAQARRQRGRGRLDLAQQCEKEAAEAELRARCQIGAKL